jgi:hypothetical protein
MEHGSTTVNGETKEDLPSTVTVKKARYSYISQKILLQFQPSVDPNDIPYEQIAWWKDIFSYIQPNDYERLHLRRLCNMFKASLKPPPKGIFTEFPHPNHPNLCSLFDRMDELYDEDLGSAPTIVFIKEGEHVRHEVEEEEDDEDLFVTYPMKIIGAGGNKTIISGYFFRIEGPKGEGKNVMKKVELKDMTVKEASDYGLWARNGLSFLCDSLTITQCGSAGVGAENTKGRLINCVITQCKGSGIVCSENALIELEGDQTKVDGNVTSGSSNYYGLNAFNTSSIIHLLFPLTQESVSTNNHNDQNYGGNGNIASE